MCMERTFKLAVITSIWILCASKNVSAINYRLNTDLADGLEFVNPMNLTPKTAFYPLSHRIIIFLFLIKPNFL